MTRGIYFRGCISIGHIIEYRNGFFSKALIENADFAKSLNMIGIVVSPAAMWVLNNKSYSSSPRFYHFVKADVSIRKPCIDLRGELPEKLALLNLIRKSTMYTNIDDSKINNIVQIQMQNTGIIKRLEEDGKILGTLINCIPEISNENLFL